MWSKNRYQSLLRMQAKEIDHLGSRHLHHIRSSTTTATKQVSSTNAVTDESPAKKAPVTPTALPQKTAAKERIENAAAPLAREHKKRLLQNEIDKLLADESTINMVYELDREHDGSNISEIQMPVEKEGNKKVYE